MRAVPPSDPLLQPGQPPTVEDLLRDPRMERIRQQSPETYQAIVTRVSAGTRPQGPAPSGPQPPHGDIVAWAAQQLHGTDQAALSDIPDPPAPGKGDPVSWARSILQPAMAAKPPPPPPAEPGFTEEVGQGLASSGQNLLGQLQQTVGFGLKQMGFQDEGESWLQSGRAHLQQGAQGAIKIPGIEGAGLGEQFQALVAHPKDFAAKLVGEAIPQSAPGLAAALGTGAVAAALLPEVAAVAIIAGAVAMGGTAALQALGSAYDSYRQQHPDAPDSEAVVHAYKEAGIDAAVNTAAAGLGVAGKGLTPLKHTLVQMVVQPTYFAGTQAARNVAEGRPATQGLVQTAATATALAPAFGLLARRGARERAGQEGAPATEAPPVQPEAAARPEAQPQAAPPQAPAGQPRTIEVPNDQGLRPGELVELDEGAAKPAQGIVAAITPEGTAQIQVLSEEPAGREFLGWAQEGMVGEPPGAPPSPEPTLAAPAAPPEATAPVQGREMGSTPVSRETAPPTEPPVVRSPPRPIPAQEVLPAPQEAPPAVEASKATPATGSAASAPAGPPPGAPAGPDAAFTERMRIAEPALRRRAIKLAKDTERGQDLLQEALLRMWERRETYKPGQPFLNWAQTVLRSVNANRARSFSRSAESRLDLGAEPADLAVQPEQEARVDLHMAEREARRTPPEGPVQAPQARPAAPPTETPPAAEAPPQGAARQPAGATTRPEVPTMRERLVQQVERARKKPAAPPERPALPMRQGAEAEVATESGNRVKTRYAVVDAADLTVSNDLEGRVNPDYPPELQPRQRDRMASRQQVDEIVARFDPAQLRESPVASMGAPIIAPDGTVESGNGRALAIREAYRRGQGQAYREMVRNAADAHAIPSSELAGKREPVLVRVRQGAMTPEERRAFTQDANVGPVARMSPVEQAVVDAGRADFSRLHVSDDGEVDTPSNREFVRLFLEGLPAAERGQLLDKGGKLNQLGRQRLTNAVFASAYGDVDTLARMMESTDNNVRNLTKGMLIAAPKFAEVKRLMSEGKAWPLDVTPFLNEATEAISALRGEGVALEDVLRQEDLVGPRWSTEAVDVMRGLLDRARSAKRVGEYLRAMAQEIENRGSPNQESLLGPEQPPTVQDVLAAGRRAEGAQGALDLAGQSAPAEGDARGPGQGTPPELGGGGEDLSRAPLSALAERRADTERQLRLAALDATRGSDAPPEQSAAARERVRALQGELRAIEEARKGAEARAAREVLAEAQRLYAKDPPTLRLVQALESGAAGDYQGAKRLVRVSLDALDLVGVYRHEALHDFRRHFLSPLENQTLDAAFAEGSRASREVIDTLRGLGHEDAAKQAQGSAEERIAHAFALRRAGELTPRPVVLRILDRLSALMERVANLFAGRGFRNAEDVFSAIDRGRAGAGAPKPAAEPPGPPAPSQAPTRLALIRRLAEATRQREPDAGMTNVQAIEDARAVLSDALSDVPWRQQWARDHIREYLGQQALDEVLRAAGSQESRSPLTAETRGKARRIKVPPRKGETLGQRAEEFQRNVTAEQPEDVLDYTAGRNTTRMNWGSDDLNRAIAEYRRLFPEGQRTQTWKETIAAAHHALSKGEITEQTILDWNTNKLPNAKEKAAGDILLSLRGEHLVKSARLAAQTRSAEDQARFQLLSAEFALMQGKVHGVTSEIARAQNISRARPLLLRNRDAAIKSIIEDAGGQDKLHELAAKVAALDEPAAVKQFMRKKWTPTWWDRVMEVWINGLLSNPGTHAKNIFGNTAFDLLQSPETLVAAALGKVRGAEPFDRVYAGEAIAALYAEVRALPEAWKLAKHAYLTEESIGPTKVEGARIAIEGKFAKNVIRQPSRFLLAEDQFAKALAYRKMLARLAYRQAADEGLSGSRMGARIDEILQEPSPEHHLAATKYADYVTFTEKAGPFAQAIMKLVDSMDLAGAKPLKLILPFIRTPAQLLDVAIERSPAAVLLKSVRASLRGENGGVARDLALSRIAVGSGLLATAFLMAGSGLLTGAGPSDARQSEMWRLGGSPLRPGVAWQPNSMWVGDRYVSIAGVDPISLPLGLAATFVESAEGMSPGERQNVFARLMGAFVKNVASKTWLQGLTDAVEVMNDPDRYGQHYLQRMAGSIVPAGVAQVARIEDPTMRDVQSTLDAIRSRVPGLSSSLPARINARGEPIQLHGAVGPDIASPFYEGPAGPTGPVARELTSLGVALGQPPRQINGHELTPEQTAEFRQERGRRVWKRLEMVVSSPSWASLSPDQRQQRAHRAIQLESRGATMRMKQRYPELRRRAPRAATGG